MTSPLRVLIVEDNEDDAALVIRELTRAGFDVESERVEASAGMKRALARQAWDVVISDFSMPQFDGSKALALLKEAGLDIPFILVSGTVGEETAVEAMRLGANDYIMKDGLARLAPAVRRELREAAGRRERGLAERRLAETRDRLDQFLAASPAAIVAAELRGDRLAPFFASPNLSPVAGWDVEVFFEDPTFMLSHVHPDDAPRVAETLSTLRERGRAVHEFRLGQPDGTYRWLHEEIVAVGDAKRDGAQVVSSLMDVTPLKEAERELTYERERSHHILENISDIVMVIKSDGVSYVSPSVESVLGYEPSQLLGQKALELMHPEDQDRPVAAMQEVVEAGCPARRLEFRMRRSDGTWCDFEGTATDRLTDPAVEGLVVVLRDVTERKKMDLLKDDFVSMISHELRTPLAVILGYAQLLARPDAAKRPDLAAKAIESILERGELMRAAVDDLLDVSRIRTGSFQLRTEPCDTRDLLEECLRLTPASDIHDLGLEAADGPLQAVCDRGRMRRALLNVIGNAVKFSPDGGRVVARVCRQGAYLRIEVEDEGIGIAPEDRGRIFDCFVQGDMSSTREFGGFGLGLHIAKLVVEAHGGSIDVKDRPGKGSTFMIDIPVSGSPPPA